MPGLKKNGFYGTDPEADSSSVKIVIQSYHEKTSFLIHSISPDYLPKLM